MPSPVGHALAGIAVAWTADVLRGQTGKAGLTADIRPLSRGQTWSAGLTPFTGSAGLAPLGLTPLCAVLAVLPDADLVHPDWHRAVTHSIGAVLLVTIISATVTGWVTGRIAWRVVLVCGAAYASHILLDWLAADSFAPYGIRALWPFDDGWYISGLNLFRQTARRHLFTMATFVQNAKAIAQEIGILGPIVYALWLVRVKPAAGLPPQLARGNHPAE